MKRFILLLVVIMLIDSKWTRKIETKRNKNHHRRRSLEKLSLNKNRLKNRNLYRLRKRNKNRSKRRKHHKKKHRGLKLKEKRHHVHHKKHKNRRRLFEGAGGGSVDAGVIKVNFPVLSKPANSPINITTPAASYPTFVSNAKKQKPIVVVPEILYPHKKKRVMVHHDRPLASYYHQSMYSMNPYWAQYARANPYYQNYVSGSTGLNNYMQSPDFQNSQSTLNKYIPVI